MKKEITNNDIYKFLAEECRNSASLWKEYGDGILSHTTDTGFWESLSRHLDCMRICDECGCPMIEGYLIDGATHYCSDECLLKHMTWNEYLEQYDEGEGDSFWTTWFEDSLTFKRWKQNRL